MVSSKKSNPRPVNRKSDAISIAQQRASPDSIKLLKHYLRYAGAVHFRGGNRKHRAGMFPSRRCLDKTLYIYMILKMG